MQVEFDYVVGVKREKVFVMAGSFLTDVGRGVSLPVLTAG